MTKKRAIIASVCAFAAVALVSSAYFGANAGLNNPQRLLSLGERYLLEMDYEQAVVCFERVIKIEPKNVRAYLGAAEAYVGLGRADKAIETLRLGLERTGDPTIADYLARLENAAAANAEAFGNAANNPPAQQGETQSAANVQNVGKSVTIKDFEDWGLPWGAVIDDLAGTGRFRITNDDVSAVFAQGDGLYLSSFDSGRRINDIQWHLQGENNTVGPRGVAIGTSVSEFMRGLETSNLLLPTVNVRKLLSQSALNCLIMRQRFEGSQKQTRTRVCFNGA